MASWYASIAVTAWRAGISAVAGFAFTVGGLTTALAQRASDPLDASSLALAAYEASRSQCRYSDKVGRALSEIDGYLTRTQGETWVARRRVGPDSLVGLRNVGRMLGGSDCQLYGSAVGGVASVYMVAAEFDPVVFGELMGLLKGGGVSTTGEAPVRPSTPEPGSFESQMAEYNRRHPDRNRSFENDPPARVAPPRSAADLPEPPKLPQPAPRSTAEPNLSPPSPASTSKDLSDGRKMEIPLASLPPPSAAPLGTSQQSATSTDQAATKAVTRRASDPQADVIERGSCSDLRIDGTRTDCSDDMRVTVQHKFPPAVSASLNRIRRTCAPSNLTIRNGFLTTKDVNGDHIADYILDHGKIECADEGYSSCGTAGCRNEVFVSGPGGSYNQVLSDNVQDLRFQIQNGRPTMILSLHGTACGKIKSAPCQRTFFWDGSTFVAADDRSASRSHVSIPSKTPEQLIRYIYNKLADVRAKPIADQDLNQLFVPDLTQLIVNERKRARLESEEASDRPWFASQEGRAINTKMRVTMLGQEGAIVRVSFTNSVDSEDRLVHRNFQLLKTPDSKWRIADVIEPGSKCSFADGLLPRSKTHPNVGGC